MSADVILLNADYSFLDTVSWRKAMKLIIKEKVEVVKETARKIADFYIPKVIKLIKFVRIVYKREVPFSKRNVFTRDNYTCQYCGKQYKRGSKAPTLDHIIPKSHGGKNTWENCVTSCKECNTLKRDRTPSEAKMYLLKRPNKPTINEFMQLKLKSHGIQKVLDDLYQSMV